MMIDEITANEASEYAAAPQHCLQRGAHERKFLEKMRRVNLIRKQVFGLDEVTIDEEAIQDLFLEHIRDLDLDERQLMAVATFAAHLKVNGSLPLLFEQIADAFKDCGGDL